MPTQQEKKNGASCRVIFSPILRSSRSNTELLHYLIYLHRDTKERYPILPSSPFSFSLSFSPSLSYLTQRPYTYDTKSLIRYPSIYLFSLSLQTLLYTFILFSFHSLSFPFIFFIMLYLINSAPLLYIISITYLPTYTTYLLVGSRSWPMSPWRPLHHPYQLLQLLTTPAV